MKSKKVSETPAITGEAGVAKISTAKKSKSKNTESGFGWGSALGGLAVGLALAKYYNVFLATQGRG